MNAEFRWTGAGSSGTAANSLTALNAPGPSAFTGQSLASDSVFSADPAGGSNTVLHIPINAAAFRRLDNTFTTANQCRQVSTSIMVYLSALPPSGGPNNLQILNAQASPDGTTTGAYTGVAASITSMGDINLAVPPATTGGSYTYPNAGPKITAGKWYRITVWADMGTTASNGVIGCAVYDTAAGTQVGSTYSNTSVNLGGATSTAVFISVWTGKADKANQAIDLYVQGHAETLGAAKDYGANPSMTVPTPPTLSGFCNMSAGAGQRVQVYCRTKPTTSGNTEVGISVTNVSAVDAVTGAAVTLDSTNQITWSAPATTSYTVGGVTVSVETNRTREATVPYLQRPLTYTCKITGTDSGGQSASQTFTLTVWSHDIWHKGTGGLVPGIITLPIVQAIRAAFMRLASGVAQFDSDANSVGTWSTDSTTGAAVYDPDTPGSSVTYAIDPTTGANVISS